MNDIIYQIIHHQNIDKIFKFVLKDLYTNGPVSVTTMEILSYLRIYANDEFARYNNSVLKYMGVNYKKIPTTSLTEVVFGMYNKHIEAIYKYSYTPVQASIVNKIEGYQCFSFSAPTSTGKSYVFRNIINSCSKDIMIIVPSRALINEYYSRLLELIPNANVNILTFIDRINTKRASRNVFIVTPERCKELFRHKRQFDIECILFDEAQLGNEESVRGLFFDSIIRRLQAAYPNAKYVFAHPFVANPDAQIVKNHFDNWSNSSYRYEQKNVGQLFYAFDAFRYYHFGIDKEVMGKQKIECAYDPLENAIRNGGSVLIYTTKKSIYSKKVFSDFGRYIDLCQEVKDTKARKHILKIKDYLGATAIRGQEKYSNMLFLLKRGIVVHHGSLPLQARMILEQFTQEGFCRICFATSTLEQGINMPFEVVFLNTFQASRPLSLKNLIGRAGRSSTETKFDFGSVVMHKSNMSEFRKILLSEDKLKDVSLLEDEDINDDYKEFRDAILSGTLSDEYNLTKNQLSKLSSTEAQRVIGKLLDNMFKHNELVPLSAINSDLLFKLDLYAQFEQLYSDYLGRSMVDGEKSVFDTAIKILLWKIHCRTFKDICFYRYAYASKLRERREIEARIQNSIGFEKVINQQRLNSLYAAFVSECKELPNKDLNNYSMFGNKETKAADVDYDRIVFDTYDYLDKIIGFHLSDIFYAAFRQYFESTEDVRADKLSKYIKYGTDREREIWMLRYGLTFEDIEWLDEHVQSINQEEIVFKSSIRNVDADRFSTVKRFINNTTKDN